MERLSGFDAWQRALADMINVRRSGPLIFFVDDKVLSELSPGSVDAAADLSDAVATMIMPNVGVGMFNTLVYRRNDWELGSQFQPPPVLPLLALTVLAGTHMRRADGLVETNYYNRLAKLISRDQASRAVERVADYLRGQCFNAVVQMWKDLDSWIRWNQDRVGTSTIRTRKRLARIGYPLSQAIVSTRDRDTLTCFFSDIHADHGVDPERLLGWLNVWRRGRGGFSVGFIGALEDPDLQDILGGVVEHLARSWDGHVVVTRRSETGEIGVILDPVEWTLQWTLDLPGGPTVLDLAGSVNGQRCHVTARRNGESYRLEGMPDVDRVDRGLSLTNGTTTARFQATRLLFFGQSAASTEPLVREPIISREYLILVPEADHDRLCADLEDAALKGWKEETGNDGARLLPGYRLVEHVRFSRPEDLRLMLGRWSRHERALGQLDRPSLESGLHVQGNLSRYIYLQGGEPDLVVPPKDGAPRYELQLDGLSDSFARNGDPLPLRKVPGACTVGWHHVAVDGHPVEDYLVVDGAQLWSGQPPEIASPDASEHGAKLASNRRTSLLIRGTTPERRQAQPQRILVWPSEEMWILRTGGETAHVVVDELRAGLSEIGLDDVDCSPFIEVRPSDEDRWLVQRWGTTWRLRDLKNSNRGECRYRGLGNPLESWTSTAKNTNRETLWTALTEEV